MPRSLKVATACGALPLLLGVAIYVAWVFTRWAWLATAGLILIVVGFASVLIGSALLTHYIWRELRTSRRIGMSAWFHVVLAGGILLANVPVAAFLALSAVNILTRYTVRVINESGNTIDSMIVTGPGVRIELGPIAPGDRVQHHLQFAGDGSLHFTARQAQTEIAGPLDGYVTSGLGGDVTIHISRDGTYDIHRRNG